MNAELLSALKDLGREKGIDEEVILEAIEAALISAYKKNFGSLQNVRVFVDRETGEFKVFARKEVVEEVFNDRSEISLEDAQKLRPDYALGDIIETEVIPKDLVELLLKRLSKSSYREFGRKNGA